MRPLLNLFEKYHMQWLFGLLSLVSFNFIGTLIIDLKDGVLDPSEFHNLSASANGVEMLILVALMMVFKSK